MQVRIKIFVDLTLNELYDLMALRSAVFVVEQDCVYQDLDYKDQKAIHVLGYENKLLVAYTRLFGPGDYFKNASIGRVIVTPAFRSKQLGHTIMKASILALQERYDMHQIEISAQSYLERFYETHGFKAEGAEYLEDGIPHKKMIKIINNP
jgi:ElaA protein